MTDLNELERAVVEAAIAEVCKESAEARARAGEARKGAVLKLIAARKPLTAREVLRLLREYGADQWGDEWEDAQHGAPMYLRLTLADLEKRLDASEGK